MATATYSDRIELQPNQPVELALKFTTGKEVGTFGNVMFSLTTDQRFFLPADEASELEHQLADLAIRAGERFRLTRVKHGTARGGGFSIRAERLGPVGGAEPPATDLRLVRQLEQSIAIAQTKAGAPGATGTPERTVQQNHSTARPEPSAAPSDDRTAAKGTMTKLLEGALVASIDAYITAGQYAKAKGFAVEFTSEDVRCAAISMLIQYWKDGGTR
jgi:hypothetical protein